jgi:hypothetical protein
LEYGGEDYMRKKYVTFIISIIFGICLVITGISIWNKYFIRSDYNENPPEVTQEEKTKYSDEYGNCTVAYLNEKTNIDKKWESLRIAIISTLG